MLGYIVAAIGALIYGVGAPSKSGRKGELSAPLTWIGLLALLGGAILSWLSHDFVQGLIVLAVGFLFALMVNRLKK